MWKKLGRFELIEEETTNIAYQLHKIERRGVVDDFVQFMNTMTYFGEIK